MRLVPPFVAFLLGAEGGILASSHFPSDSDGNHWGCIEKDFQALFKSFTWLYWAGQPPAQQHTHSLLSELANASSLWREENGPVVPSELGIDPLSLADA